MGIAVLGPLEVGGEASTLGLRDRVVLEALAVHSGSVVSPDSLAEAIWGEAPPASWAKVVQGCIVRLRKALGSEAIETTPRGYRLRVHVDHLDNLRFEHLIGRARELLALGEPERAVYVLDEALGLWRGDPFTELAEWGPGRIELERLVRAARGRRRPAHRGAAAVRASSGGAPSPRCVWCRRRRSVSGGGACWPWRSTRTDASGMPWRPCTAPAR